jgi:hypothetical protein
MELDVRVGPISKRGAEKRVPKYVMGERRKKIREYTYIS